MRPIKQNKIRKSEEGKIDIKVLNELLEKAGVGISGSEELKRIIVAAQELKKEGDDNEKHLKPVKQIKLKEKMTVSELLKEMGNAGVMGGGKLAKAADIFEKMVKDKECKVFFGFAGAMVPGGMRQIIVDMLEKGWIDVFVSTGANLTHDLIEALGFNHYQGKAYDDDFELKKKNIDRIYDSYMLDQVYYKLEEFFKEIFPKINKEKSIKDFLWKIGSFVDNGILHTCYKKKIPIFCPGIADSGIGMMIWGNLVSDSKNTIDVGAFEDLKEIMDIAWTSKKNGVFYIGGGVPKNYIQQAMQFSDLQDGASYGIQITMDRPEHGGSSGAPLREGISWGKMSHEGDQVTLICDTTIALPVIYAAVLDRI